MASIVFRNSSRRLLRAYFSKLGWQANVIWRIAFFNQLQVYPSWLWRSDLFRASLDLDLDSQSLTLAGITDRKEGPAPGSSILAWLIRYSTRRACWRIWLELRVTSTRS